MIYLGLYNTVEIKKNIIIVAEKIKNTQRFS